MHLKPDRFTTYVSRFDTPDGVFERRVWTYETDSALYDVTHANDGHMRYRVNMESWTDDSMPVHVAIVSHFRLQPGENNGDRLC